MSTAWIGGLQVHSGKHGPVADYLCTACWHHQRVRGEAKVIDFVRANPAADHAVKCKPKTTDRRPT